MTSRTAGLAGLLFFSGACALVFQVAWLREFRLVFGSSTAATAAVLAIFMGGLGFGNALLGRFVNNHSRPLRTYACLELLIALVVAASPWLLDECRLLYVSWGGQVTMGAWGATAARLSLSLIVLGLPTMLMGGTLPAAAKAALSHDDSQRTGIGLLYGCNTLGAVFGTVASTFLLLEQLGTRQTLWLACAVNLLVGGVALAWSLRLPVQSPNVDERELTANQSTDGFQTSTKGTRIFVYVSAAVVGFAFLLLELVWYRMLGPILGGTTFTFGLILAVALLGIGLGGGAYSLLFRQRTPTIGTFALTCGCEALCVATPFAMSDWLALQVATWKMSSTSFSTEVTLWFVVAAIVVLPAALVSGVQFPLLIALLGKGKRDVAKQVGAAFAWNTVGAIGGSLVGGFGILPLLTATGTWWAMVELLCLLGIGGVWLDYHQRRSFRAVALPGTIAVLSLLLLLPTGPTAVLRHSSIGAGRAKLPQENLNQLHEWKNRTRGQVLWEADGVESSVAIVGGDGLAFMVNGKSDGHSLLDAGTQVMLGLIGGVLHENPRSGLVVGLGTGESAGWLADLPSMQRVDVVELESAVDEMATRCALVNRNVMANPKVRRIYNDAREVLLTTPERYDLIVSEPSNPYRAGVATLYTREFYAAARRRLNETGLFVQWLQGYEIDFTAVRMVLGTIAAEFPHVEIWQTQVGDLLLVCGEQPPTYNPEQLRERLKQPVLAAGLRFAWRVDDLEGVLAHYVAGDKTVREVAAAAPLLNTDDRNVLEYGFARTVGRQKECSDLMLRGRAIENNDARPTVLAVDTTIDWSFVNDEFVALFARQRHDVTVVNAMRLTDEQKEWGQALVAFFHDKHEPLLGVLAKNGRIPRSPTELLAASHVLATAGDAAAEPLIERLRAIRAVEADGVEAILREKQGQTERAVELAERAFVGLRTEPSLLFPTPVFEVILRLALTDKSLALRLLAAVEQPFAVGFHDEQRRFTALLIASKIDPIQFAQHVETFEPHVPWTEPFLKLRLVAYAAVEHPRLFQAVLDWQSFQAGGAAVANELLE